MTIDPKLLELLVCPACRGRLEPPSSSGLECSSCGRVFPVRDGIPVMLVDEASEPTRGPGRERPQTGPGTPAP